MKITAGEISAAARTRRRSNTSAPRLMKPRSATATKPFPSWVGWWRGILVRSAAARMAEIALESLSKVYPDGTRAVSDLDLQIEDGELMVFVGPSGCGKTTALRMVAGLEEITAGVVRIGDRVVNKLPPKDRDVAMVFQNYALYPHMNAFDNMAFGLKLRKVRRRDIGARVQGAARTLGLAESLKKKPRTLSGGQRQRVAMGRAIVREPRAFLMD